MYIDTVPNRKSPPAILLRESYRQNGKVKKRTLANLSKLPAEIVGLIRQALAGPVQVVGQSLSGAVFGLLFVLNELARQCGLQRALGHSRLASLTLFLVLARIAHQGSRLSAVRWAREHAVKAVLGLGSFDEDDLYEALDWAAEQQEAIEQQLYRDYVKRTGQTPALVLYDVTSSYFEGENNALGEFGYNRDGKKGKKQIVIGLLTAADGEPLSVEVFKGSTGDHCQISPGKFLATTDYAQVNGILLYRQRYTRRALVTGATPAGYLALGSSCTEQAHVRWCGEETNSQCLAYGFDSSDTEFLLPDGSDHWAILVPKDLLFGYLGEESAADLLRNRHVLRCESKLGHQLFGMVGPYYPKVEGAQRRCEQ